jgi:hypothetical protein
VLVNPHNIMKNNSAFMLAVDIAGARGTILLRRGIYLCNFYRLKNRAQTLKGITDNDFYLLTGRALRGFGPAVRPDGVEPRYEEQRGQRTHG